MRTHCSTLTNTTFSSYFYFYPSLLLYSHSYLFRNSYPENYRYLKYLQQIVTNKTNRKKKSVKMITLYVNSSHNVT